LGAPLLIFFGRRPRLAGWAGIVGLQLLILGTGNYTFFNLLTIALSLLLLDDSIWRRVLPRLAGWLVPAQLPVRARAGPRLAIATFAIVLLPLQVGSFIEAVGPSGSTPVSLERALEWLAPFRSVNGYGLFRVMTTERAEIILEGSLDGAAWRAYQFRYKPGALEARPGFVQPHQPRLDWQMWFAALDRFGRTSWVQAFMARLLEGSPPVVGLLASNPFPDRPPKYLRATLYDYRFTDWATRSATKAWWVRTELGPYSPVVSLADSTAAPR
jgi:hypothetical protein